MWATYTVNAKNGVAVGTLPTQLHSDHIKLLRFSHHRPRCLLAREWRDSFPQPTSPMLSGCFSFDFQEEGRSTEKTPTGLKIAAEINRNSYMKLPCGPTFQKLSCIILGFLLGKAQLGGQNVSCDFGEWETYYRARPPKLGLEGSESGIGLVCAHYLKENDRVRTKGGGTIS